MSDNQLRAKIEAMRERNLKRYGTKDTYQIDSELVGRSLVERYKAWMELSQ